MHQGDGAQRALLSIDGEQDAAAIGKDVMLGIAEHFAVEWLHHEPALQPFDVEGREILAPARIEGDHADAVHAHASVRCATAAVAASRSLSSNGVMWNHSMVPASRQRPLTLKPSGWLRGT